LCTKVHVGKLDGSPFSLNLQVSICICYYITIFVFLGRLESPLEFSVPLISASLTYGPAYKTTNPGTKICPLQHSKSYRFNYINRKSCKNSESEEETNQDT